MATLADLTDLKTKVEELKTKHDKAVGALEESMKQLETKFGCESLEDAQTMLEDLKAKEDEAKEAFDRAMSKFEKQWGDVLGEW